MKGFQERKQNSKLGHPNATGFARFSQDGRNEEKETQETIFK
jgi:hypothetical protein